MTDTEKKILFWLKFSVACFVGNVAILIFNLARVAHIVGWL